jgi:hypothetical protein
LAKLLLLALLALLSFAANAATINAASCTDAAMDTALTSAAHGDTINVPTGNCDWSSIAVDKAVTVVGGGSSTSGTVITFTAEHALTVTKQSAGLIVFKNFRFLTAQAVRSILVQGSWQGTEPVIFQDSYWDQGEYRDFFFVAVAGGFIFSGNTAVGPRDPYAGAAMFHFKDTTNTDSWTTADTLGDRDTDGKDNLYIETNSFSGFNAAGLLDCDDNCRLVLRYNTMEYTGYNSHGNDTSSYGTRHFEIYENDFTYPDPNWNGANVPGGWVWIRGGTGVVFNNAFANITGSWWGDKTECFIHIRGAEDVRPQGACGSTSYPVPHQAGRNHNGTSEFTDPIRFWNNTGTLSIVDDWNWGNPCGFTWSDFFQWGRDAYNNGTSRPGYTAYTYPHPLLGGAAPSAPTGFRLVDLQ